VDDTVSRPRVVVLADDLIWQTRLTNILEGIGARVDRRRGGLDETLVDADALVVDLTARSYDAIAAIERGSAAGLRILAVGQHDDAALRKRALAAGAERVYAYRKLFEDGPATLVAWLGAEALGIQKRTG
jgi:electron transfer flavoprotein alpha/beta subunit